MLNERKLTRAMIEEWKAGGYIVGRFDMEGDDMLMLISPDWKHVLDALKKVRI